MMREEVDRVESLEDDDWISVICNIQAETFWKDHGFVIDEHALAEVRFAKLVIQELRDLVVS